MIPPSSRPGARRLFVAFASLLCALAQMASAEILVKPGEKVAFSGLDYCTRMGKSGRLREAGRGGF